MAPFRPRARRGVASCDSADRSERPGPLQSCAPWAGPPAVHAWLVLGPSVCMGLPFGLSDRAGAVIAGEAVHALSAAWCATPCCAPLVPTTFRGAWRGRLRAAAGRCIAHKWAAALQAGLHGLWWFWARPLLTQLAGLCAAIKPKHCTAVKPAGRLDRPACLAQGANEGGLRRRCGPLWSQARTSEAEPAEVRPLDWRIKPLIETMVQTRSSAVADSRRRGLPQDGGREYTSRGVFTLIPGT